MIIKRVFANELESMCCRFKSESVGEIRDFSHPEVLMNNDNAILNSDIENVLRNHRREQLRR